MPREEGLVSVLMPVRNAKPFLSEAIDSILRQTLRNIELVIVDDGSTDDSNDVVLAYAAIDSRVRYVRRHQRGLVAALNEAISLSRGCYVARMDADDVAHPDRLLLQMAFLAANRDCVAVGSQVECIDRDGSLIGFLKYEQSHEDIEDRLLCRRLGPTMAHPAVTMRRSVLEAVGGYRAKFQASEDRDLWLRLGERGRLANLPDVLLRYRLHLDSFSHARGAEQRRMAEVAVRDAHERRGLGLPEDFSVPKWHRESPFDTVCDWVALATRDGNLETARKHLRYAFLSQPLGYRCWRLAANLGIATLRPGRRRPGMESPFGATRAEWHSR